MGLAQGLQIPFVLTPALPGDDIELEFRPDLPMGDPRTLRVRPRLEDGRLIVPSSELLRLPLGQASLLVALYGRETRDGAVSMRYAVMHRTVVQVNK